MPTASNSRFATKHSSNLRKHHLVFYVYRFLEDQCVKMKIPLKWPDNLYEFNISMKNLREDKHISEQNLFDEIVADVSDNASFARD